MTLRGRARSLVALFGHTVREGSLWVRYAGDRVARRTTVVAFLEGDETSGRLRARAVARAMRRLGWAAVLVPRQLSLGQRHRVLSRTRPVVTVLQQCRHPLNDPELLDGAGRLVLDLDDADWLDELRRVHLERVAAKVDLVVAGSRRVARWAEDHNSNVEVIWTTAPVPRSRRKPANIPPIVAWASSNADGLPHERALVSDVLTRVAAGGAKFRLWIFGVTDADLVRADFAALTAHGVEVRCFAPMSYRPFIAALSKADIGLNPLCDEDNPYAVGKSFGKVLAYLVARVAVVTTTSVDHPLFFEDGRNGFLCASTEMWADRVAWLVDHPRERREMVDAAWRSYMQRLTPAAAADLLTSAFARHLHLAPNALTPASSRRVLR